MNCKNCNHPIEGDDLFCENCGAKVIRHRITLRSLINEVLASVGLNNLYFTTLKTMFLAPEKVLQEYLNGVRKRYLAPFTFLLIGAGFSLLVFNFFPEDFKKMQTSSIDIQEKGLEEKANVDLSKFSDLTKKEYEKIEGEKKRAVWELKFNKAFGEFFFGFLSRNYNLVTLFFIPFYALLSYLVYRKTHNFGEHIIMNAYLQGVAFLIQVLLFLIAILFSNPSIFIWCSVLCTVILYSYAFGKLYQYNFKRIFTKFLRFLLFLIVIGLPVFSIIIIGVMLIFFIDNPELIPKGS